MATKYIETEVWILVDACGDYVASHDGTLLNDLYEEHIQPVADAEGTRRVKVTVRVPLPAVLEASAVLTEEAEASAAAQ